MCRLQLRMTRVQHQQLAMCHQMLQSQPGQLQRTCLPKHPACSSGLDKELLW